MVVTVGFEPTKRKALDLKSSPVDQAWVRYLTVTKDTFSSELIESTKLVPTVGLEPTTTGLKVLRSTN